MRSSRIHRRVDDAIMETIASFIDNYEDAELIDYVKKVYIADPNNNFDPIDREVAIACAFALNDRAVDTDLEHLRVDLVACFEKLIELLEKNKVTERRNIVGE